MMEMPATQKEAYALGAKLYFSGKPCIRGHVSTRYAHGSCTACQAERRATNADAKAEYARQWRLRNPEKRVEYRQKAKSNGADADYYARNREKQIEKASAWNKANSERVKKNQRKRYKSEDVRKRLLELGKQSRLRRLEQCRAKDREYNARNKERRAAYAREWRQSNKELVRTIDANKKARRKGAPGSYKKSDIAEILSAQKCKCAWCQTSIRAGYHVDHIAPLISGGTNYRSNLQLLCPPCNLRKKATDPIDFARREGRLL